MYENVTVIKKVWSPKPKNQLEKNNVSIKQLSNVLSLCANARPQLWHWSTALSTTLCFSWAQTEMRRCTETKPYLFSSASTWK